MGFAVQVVCYSLSSPAQSPRESGCPVLHPLTAPGGPVPRDCFAAGSSAGWGGVGVDPTCGQPNLTMPSHLPLPCDLFRFTETDVSMIVTLLRACGLQLRAGRRAGATRRPWGAGCLQSCLPMPGSRLAMKGHTLALCSPSLGCCTSLFPSPTPYRHPTRPAADPVAMKDFVVAVHARAGEAGGAGKLTKRAQILLELVVDVKNNRWDTCGEGAGKGGCLQSLMAPALATLFTTRLLEGAQHGSLSGGGLLAISRALPPAEFPAGDARTPSAAWSSWRQLSANGSRPAAPLTWRSAASAGARCCSPTRG